jgi:hypothetical protein
MSDYKILDLCIDRIRSIATQRGDGFWRVQHAADYLYVSIESGTVLALNVLTIEIKDSCTICFPIVAMGYTDIAFSKKPRNLRYEYRYVSGGDVGDAQIRLRRTMSLPDGTTLNIVNGLVTNVNR